MKTLLTIEQPLCREAMAGLVTGLFGACEVVQTRSLDEGLEALAKGGISLVIAALCAEGVSDGGLVRLVEAAGAPVIVLDVRHDAGAAHRAAAAGARGYLPLTESRDLISAAIGVVVAGGTYFPQEPQRNAPPQPSSASRRLSPRQVQVLEQLLQGRTNREIADALGIALPTVKLHVHAILSVTGARNRTEAVLLAKEGRLAGVG